MSPRPLHMSFSSQPLGSIYPLSNDLSDRQIEALKRSRKAHVFSTLSKTNAETDPINKASVLWGKSSSAGPQSHCALVAHSLAVAACFYAILQIPGVKKSIQRAIGSEQIPLSLLIWSAAMHDLGKAHPFFQYRRTEIIHWLADRFDITRPDGLNDLENFDHGNHGGRRLWPHVFEKMKGLGYFDSSTWGSSSRRNLRGLMYSAFAHHGEHGRPEAVSEDGPEFVEAAVDFSVGIADVIEAMHGDFVPMDFIKSPVVFSQIMAGWITLADWIASNELMFEYINCQDFVSIYNDPKSWSEIYALYVSIARIEIEKLGLNINPLTASWEKSVMRDFKMNAVQKTTLKAANIIMSEPGGGGLLIVEGQMGSGKTEAALLACGGWIDAGMCHGLAFGLPAQASANMVVKRMMNLCRSVYGVDPNIAHANSALMKLRMKEEGDACLDSAGYNLDEWITDSNRRAFLAPLTAATVDQLELSVMHSKHGFVRFAALTRQAVVIDEVHAYDAYMQGIIKNLLSALGAAQVPVVLLSATLPSYQRAAYCLAYAQGAGWKVERDISNDHCYPLVTYVGETAGWGSIPVQWKEPEKKVLIESYYVDSVVDKVIDMVNKGRCVALIVNTKRSARIWYQIFRRHFLNSKPGKHPVDIQLMHSGFRSHDRLEKQERIESFLGPDSKQKQRRGKITVSTQILEQSIDIDIDYMISEPGPADLMLQRMGRLFRHQRKWRNYVPRFAVLIPKIRDKRKGERWYRSSVNKIYAEGGKLDESLDLFIAISRMEKVKDRYVRLPSQIPEIVAKVYGSGDDGVFTVQQTSQEKKAQDIILKLTNPIDNIPLDTIISSATRDIDVETIQVLLVLKDKTTGKIKIPSSRGDVILPELYMPSGRRLNMDFLNQAQKWLLPIKMQSGNDDPDFFVRMLQSFMDGYKAIKKHNSQTDIPIPPFIVIECEESSSRNGHVKMLIGKTPSHHRVFYDTETGVHY